MSPLHTRLIAPLLMAGLMTGLVAGSAMAQTTRPTTQPDTPIAALIRHAIAMSGGDAAGVRAAYHAEDDEQTKLVEAYAGVCQATADLRKAAIACFGEDGFSAIGFGAMYNVEVERLQSARQQIEGNRATVFVKNIHPGGVSEVQLAMVNVKGQWKISVADTFKKGLDRRIARIDAQAGAYRELANEIAAGRYKLAVEARLAGRDKVLMAMRQAELPPATQPK